MSELLIGFAMICVVFGLVLWSIRTMELPVIVYRGAIVLGVLLMVLWVIRHAMPALNIRV